MPSILDPERSRKLLKKERERIIKLKTTLTMPDGAINGTGDALAELSSPTQHPADLGTETFERAKDVSIVASLDGQLQDLDRALERLGRGTYGVCEACGERIAPARLEAMPGTRFCIHDQAAAERALSA